MPLQVPSLLRQMYERVNPNTCEFVEIAQPDVGQVLRRWVDQFSVNPPRLSETPATTTQSSPGGGIMLKATAGNLVSMYTDALVRISLSMPDTSKLIRGVGWKLDPALQPVRLKRFTAKISVTTPIITHLELQIFRMHGVPGRVINNTTGQIVAQLVQYTPVALLPQPARVHISSFSTGSNTTNDFIWDLTAFELDVQHSDVPAPSLSQVGDFPELIFAIWNTDRSADGKYRWEEDIASARTVAGLGTFQDVTWQVKLPNGSIPQDPNDPRATYVRSTSAQVPCFKIDVDSYPATSQEVFALTLPRAPAAATTGRVRFVRELPIGTSATAEISSAGSGGPWTAVTEGSDLNALGIPKQATYHMRLTMNASSDFHRSPETEAIGVEYATPVDVSAEATVEPCAQDINVPFGDGAIGEGKVTIVRTGRRDYHDPASDLLATAAATQLQVDHYLGSRHPAITRAHWLRLGRALVTAAEPTDTSEILSTISYLKATKRAIPKRAEQVNAVLTVNTSTATAITISPGPLPAVTSGDEYDGKNYYVRIVKTTNANLAAGDVYPVAGNTLTTQIDLIAPGMPDALNAGDTFELHSGSFQQPKLSWVNADPADVWYEILTVRQGVPPEKIGLAALGRAGRAGLPPKVTDRAPGDTTRQNRLKVSRTLSDETEGKILIDSLSYLMQGSTVEIQGQICFISVYDMLDALGNIVIPPSKIAAFFDVRDYTNLQTPRGLESRATIASCDYGVDTSLGKDAPKPSTVVFADADAQDWYLQQDLEDIGNTKIGDDIAAWCFNSADGGLLLASIACQQLVRATSTGRRVWPWRATASHPDLVVGDRVMLVTDRVVDYDPTRKIPIRGLWAFPLVLVHVADRGRELRGYMLGLWTAVPVLGGSGSSAVGTVGQPSIGSISFSPTGDLLVSMNQGTPSGGGFRLAASASAVPTDSTVDGTAFHSGGAAIVNLGGGWTSGTTVQVKVIAYTSADLAGPRSLPSLGHATVPAAGGGTVSVDTLAQSGNYSADQVTMSWVGHGAISSYDVYVWESAVDGTGALPSFRANVSASPYVFNLGVNIQTGPRPAYDDVSFYIVAKDAGGSTLAISSTDSSGHYGYSPFI